MSPDAWRLQDSPLHLLRRIHRRIDFAGLRAQGVTPRQAGVLAAVGAGPRQTQRAVGRQTGIDSSTLSALIAGLEERGLLARTRARADRRASALRLTARGRRVLRQALPALQEADRQLLACLAADRRRLLLDLLRDVALGLEASQSPRRPLSPRLRRGS